MHRDLPSDSLYPQLLQHEGPDQAKAGSQEHHPLSSQVHQQEAGVEMEYLGPELALPQGALVL